MNIFWTRLALVDLNSAYDHIAEKNPSAAASVMERIRESAAMLLRHPYLGRPGRVEGARELVVSGAPFVIAYRVKKQRIEIAAVIHGARRWPDAI